MAAALATVPAVPAAYKTVTVNLTGGPLSVPVVFTISTPGHGRTVLNAATDGTGAASVSTVVSTGGPLAVSVSQPSTSVVATLNSNVSGQ